MIIEKPGNAISAESFIQNLRNETASLHTQLEALPLSVSLTHPQLNLQDYILYLQKMYHINQYVEEHFFPLVHHVLEDVEQRKKSPLIQDDLIYLNVDINATNEFSILSETPVDTAFALGVLYVLEGSTLGGRMILKNVQPALQLTPENGAAYFAGYQSDTSKMWKYFLNRLEDYRLHNNCDEIIITGAVTAFRSIIDYMKK